MMTLDMATPNQYPLDPTRPGGEHEVDISQLTLVLANSTQGAEYLKACHEFEPWGNGMPYEAFERVVERELAEGGWAKNGGDLVWVLVRRDDVTGHILAGCETHRFKALIKRNEHDTVEDTWCYGITSVIVPTPNRRKGYAVHMLRLLHYILASPTHLPPFPVQWGKPPTVTSDTRRMVPFAMASILWSDIGQGYYQQCTVGTDLPGWVVKPEDQRELVWKLRSPIPISTRNGNSTNGTDDIRMAQQEGEVDNDEFDYEGWEILYQDDLPAIAKALFQPAKQRLNNIKAPNLPAMSLNPHSDGLLSFIPQRGTFYPQPQWRSNVDLSREPMGIRRHSTIVIFARSNYQVGERLLITYLHHVKPNDVASMLRVLDRMSDGSGMEEGWVWDLDPQSELVNTWKEGQGRETRTGLRSGIGSHLFGLVWYGGGQGQFVDKQMWNWL